MPDANHMPDDLRAVLSDPGIVIRQDAAVFDLIARWTHAPAATATANPPVTYDANLLEHLARQTQAARATTGAGC
jgi:hypothetical protein